MHVTQSCVQAMYSACSPPTAMRMLEEFVELKAGDVVVQNGANSAVGQVTFRTQCHLY